MMSNKVILTLSLDLGCSLSRSWKTELTGIRRDVVAVVDLSECGGNAVSGNEYDSSVTLTSSGKERRNEQSVYAMT